MKPADTRAVKLLAKIIAAGWFDVTRLASELVIDERTLGEYLAGKKVMPADRQLCLGRFLVANVPALARNGHQLVAQAQAAIRFHQLDRGRELPAERLGLVGGSHHRHRGAE
jgi:hypothetical protein